MSIYIRATASISPQKTFGRVPFLTEPIEYTGNRLTCVEPDYKGLIDVKLIRRMSRIIKMGVAAASECLQEAGGVSPDAIITGTAFGCLEDTGLFLTRIIQQQEEMLSPTAFIQSTHNTVGGQIALMLQCHHYNNTFVHRGFSFESALLDGMMLLQEKEASHVLVGSVDEITDSSHAILTRFGLYKRLPGSKGVDSEGVDPKGFDSKGTLAGEGAAFFLLTDQPSASDYARFDAITTFYKPHDIRDIQDQISSFLTVHSIGIEDIDLIITGNNGDTKGDTIYRQLKQTIFSRSDSIHYKNLCGEYPSSASFALWLAANIIKTGAVPAAVYRDHEDNRFRDGNDDLYQEGNDDRHQDGKSNAIRRILIYNHYQNIHHSLLLLSAC